MPQMAPISWLILFLMFSVIFIMFNILNYYCFYKKESLISEETNKKINKNLTWKW